MRNYLFVGAAIAALASIPATAQPVRQGPMAQPLTRASVQANVQARFAQVDSNRDGYVTRDEAQARAGEARERMQARRGERRERFAERRAERRSGLFDRIDTNNDGSISRSEFDAHAGARAERRAARGGDGELRGRRGMRHGRMMRGQRMGGGLGGGFGLAMFDRLDGDRDGRVSLAEATARALSMFDRADANRDGTVTVEERRAVRQNFRQDRRGRDRG
jgi:Ca2+-binding EF-hand superfamily protein